MKPLLLDRLELISLTDTRQPKRMCDWLSARGWVYEPPSRRGDVPKVSRAYCEARMSGAKPSERRTGPQLDFMLHPQ